MSKPFTKILKKIFIWTTIVVVALLIILIAVAAIFEKQIGKQVIAVLKKQLKTELTIDDFDLSLISGFPNASANLRTVSLDDALGDKLLEADLISCRFGLLSLFGSDIKVSSIVLKDGTMKIVTNDGRGRSNLDILAESDKEKEKTEEESNFGLSLDKATLENIEIHYIDAKAKQHIRLVVEEAQVSGNFSSNKFSLNSFAEIDSRYIKFDKVKYLINKRLYYDADIDVDLEKGLYELNDVNLGISSNFFKASGYVQTVGKDTDMDLTLKSKSGTLESVAALLPAPYLKYIEGFKSKGDFKFDAAIKGRLNDKINPAVNVNFSLDNGYVKSDLLDDPLKNVSFQASFDNGKYKNNASSTFSLKGFTGTFNRNPININLDLANLDNPDVDFSMNGTLPLESVHALFGNPAISDGSGLITFENIKVKGRAYDMVRTSRAGNIDASGAIAFNNASLTLNKKKLEFDEGNIQLLDNNLTVENLKFSGPDTEIQIDGNFQNLIPVILADSTNSKNADLRFTAELYAPEFDVDQLIGAFIPPQVPQSYSTTTPKGGTPPPSDEYGIGYYSNYLNGTFQAKIDKYNYNEIIGKDFYGKLVFDNREIDIVGKTKAMGGSLDLDGKAFLQSKPYMNVKLICEDVDVKEFFRQTENFGQGVLTQDNLKGNLDAKLAIYAFWDQNLNFLTNDLRVLGDITMQDGELNDFEMLYDFSNVINLRDLRSIRFNTLQNWLEIKNGWLFIPVMFIQSNALNLTINGAHSLENDINYNIKVNAGQVIANKLKSHDPTLSPLKAKRSGWFNLYYSIKGDLEDFEVESDRKGVKRKFERSERQKEEIKAQLYSEFGPIITLEEPVDWKDEIPEYEEEEGDIEDVDFIEEWDEEGGR